LVGKLLRQLGKLLGQRGDIVVMLGQRGDIVVVLGERGDIVVVLGERGKCKLRHLFG
jgi:hypothetical protein